MTELSHPFSAYIVEQGEDCPMLTEGCRHHVTLGTGGRRILQCPPQPFHCIFTVFSSSPASSGCPHPRPGNIPISPFSCHTASPEKGTLLYPGSGVASPHYPKQTTDIWQRQGSSPASPAVIKPSWAPRRVQPGSHIPRVGL